MRPDDEVVSIAGYNGSEHPKSVEIIALMKEAFIAAAHKNEYKATAVVYDVRVVLPSNEEKSDAIAVSLNHRDGYSVVVLFPYKIDAAKLVWGKIFAHKGEADIFPPLS